MRLPFTDAYWSARPKQRYRAESKYKLLINIHDHVTHVPCATSSSALRVRLHSRHHDAHNNFDTKGDLE